MKSILKLNDGFIKYHGCSLYRRDRTNILVTKNRSCKTPINQCFWMNALNIKSKIRTRYNELHDSICFKNNYKTQFKNEAKNNHESYSSEYESNTDSNTESDTESNTDETGYSSDRLIIDENK